MQLKMPPEGSPDTEDGFSEGPSTATEAPNDGSKTSVSENKEAEEVAASSPEYP